ncbi:MAG: hypothetical protein JO266_02395 [Acidobacteria bacterium]|nr:hypothetical protein [Acidobacteriota bacterium]
MDARPEVRKLMTAEFGNLWAGIISREISSHAIDHAPPIATSRTPVPVVTFSPGLGGTGFDYKKVKEKQLQELRPGSYDVVLHSPEIAHPSFSDEPPLFHGGDGFPETPIVLHNLDLITQFIRAFLDKTLLGEKQPLSTAVSLPFPKRPSRRMATDSYGYRFQGKSLIELPLRVMFRNTS